MLRTDSMPRSENTALKQAEGRFDGIGVNVALNVNSELVHDPLVFLAMSCSTCRASILVQIVGHQDFNVIGDILSDVLFKGSGANIVSVEESQFALTLPNADHDFLVARPTPALAVAPTADVGFVHFDNAIQFRSVRFGHSRSDAMTEIPRSLIGHSECPLNLARAHALFRFAEQQRSEKPLPKREVGIMEDRSRCYAELIMAPVTVVLKAIGDWSGVSLAARALRSVWPSQLFQNLAAFLVAAKPFAQLGDVYVARQ